MKTVKSLLEAKRDAKKGNHSVVITSNYRRFYYYETPICFVNDRNKTFMTNNWGWNTKSTNRSINSYRKQLKEKGYREVGG